MQPSLYSYLLVSAALLIPTFITAWRAKWRSRWLRLALWGGLVLAIFGVWRYVRPTDSAQVASVAEVDAAIGHGTPVLLELYSEY